MRYISDIIDAEYAEIHEVTAWVNNMYDRMFSQPFIKVRELYHHMKSEIRVITDSELEWALTELPLELFNVAEILNQLRLEHEVIKLDNKQKRKHIAAELKATGASKTDDIAAEMVEFDIVAAAYDSLISRVENELSYSKEFIMGCKKIWDARRRTESSNPISPVSPELPDYNEAQPSFYIR